jgi:uncharacterized protein (TIGR04222 family)
MGQPWGLSDSQFLGIYAAGTAAMVLLPVAFWGVIRYVPGRPLFTSELDPYQVGCLAYGPRGVADVIIAESVLSGALRVDSAGRLSEVSPAAMSGPYAAAVAGLPNGLSTASARWRVKSDPGITDVVRGLQAKGLMISKPRIITLRLIAAAGIVAVLAIGIARMTVTAPDTHANGFIVLLFCLGFGIGLVPFGFLLTHPPRITRPGAAYLRQLRAAHKAGGVVKSRSNSGVAFGFPDYPPVTAGTDRAALLDVALLGLSGIQDEKLRSALLAGLSSPSRSSGSSSSGCGTDGSGSHGGGGHGCGHGCGGHGCGGI